MGANAKIVDRFKWNWIIKVSIHFSVLIRPEVMIIPIITFYLVILEPMGQQNLIAGDVHSPKTENLS